jgi:hypothetical protein
MTTHVPPEGALEDSRRRSVLWLVLGAGLVAALALPSWVVMGGADGAAGSKPVPSPTPSTDPSASLAAPQAAGGNGQGNGGNQGHPITLSGVVQGQVAPGGTAPLVVTIANQNNQDILVTSVTGSVTSVTSAGQTGKPACSTSWYRVGSFAGSLRVHKNASGTVMLPVSFLNAPAVNQDNCKGARYTFSFTAQATQA